MSTVEKIWLAVGFSGQAIFTMRFLVQWMASERKRDSVVPVAFWWLSLFGGMTLLSYASYKRDPVIITGQAMGVLIYTRNLMLVAKKKKRVAKETRRARKPHVVEVIEVVRERSRRDDD
jgi:lipid-A-disaccharide synthase-like uncharacterized protein